jgi:RNA polymerase sigma factor (sigma-70 family)
MRKYRNKAVAELATELCSGLVRLRKGYLDAAEELIKLIDTSQSYPYEFAVYRLTGYRPADSGSPMPALEGASLRHDMLQILLDVSESFDLNTRDCDETVYDTTAMARRFNVSTKTIQRWRNRGLPARRLFFPDGKRRVGFLESSVAWFLRDHQTEVLRSSSFSQLSDTERHDIIRRAKRMSGFTQCSLGDVSRRLSKRSGRAVETIRYTIRRYDNENPGEAIFPHLLSSLGDMEKRLIYRSFLRGISVPKLADQYHRTRGSIYRIVNMMRAMQLVQRPISYVHNSDFDETDAKQIFQSDADTDEKEPSRKKPIKIKAPDGLPPYLKSLYDVPLLSAKKEHELFFRYNYLKYHADVLRRKLDMNHVLARHVREIESLLLQANMVKNQIVRANLRLVVSIAKKHISGPLNLFELISDGNISLMRAVEKFDYGRGFRFSTYSSWAIMRNYARSVPKERYQLDRFSTGHEGVLDIAASLRSYDPNDTNLAEIRESIDVMLEHLSPRERTILIDHYGLDEANQAKTFDQLGRQLGISKERVRQIEIRALGKLREIAEPENV